MAFILFLPLCAALQSGPVARASRPSVDSSAAPRTAVLDRRSALAAGLALATPLVRPLAAHASGGATAGKTTSIPRAKLRYYDRVSAAIGSFQGMGSKLTDKASCKQAAKDFFSDADDSPLSELKSAGYLLSVAFKIDTKIPPDKIQQVKDYKVAMKDLGALRSSMASGAVDDAKKAYSKARASVEVYLEGVELPPLGDARYQ